MNKVVQRNYSIAGRSLEEIVEQVRLVLSYEGEVSKVVVTRGNILAEYVVPDTEPPYGDIPESPVDNLADAMGRTPLEPLKNQDNCFSLVRMEALAAISATLVQASEAMMVGLAWVTSNEEHFWAWLGVSKPVSRLLGIPVYVLSDDMMADHNVILLCGRTTAVSPLKSEFGILIDMGG